MHGFTTLKNNHALVPFSFNRSCICNKLQMRRERRPCWCQKVLPFLEFPAFLGISAADFIFEADDEQFGTLDWFLYVGISCLLVLFTGIMSGLTLGLMSLTVIDLELLQQSGTSSAKKQAAAILPVVQKQHQLLNLASM